MRTTGKIVSLNLSFLSKQAAVTFEVAANPEDIEQFQNMELDISFDKHKVSKSEDQRKYFYKLVNLIAQKMRVPDAEVHDKLISENIAYHVKDGALDWVANEWKPNQYGLVRVDDSYYLDAHMEVKLQKEDGSVLTKNGEPKTARIFWHIKGVAQMDMQEMSRLIDNAVAQAKELGIPTETPEELRMMKERWGLSLES